jgi:hypothetical protein
MKITETDIQDVTHKNIAENKQLIADSVIENLYPLFDEVYQAKMSQVFQLRNKVKAKQKQMHTEKETMQKLMAAYQKEKKISKLLERIEKLVQAGLTYDGTMKHEIVILLKIIDKLPSDKLDQQLNKTMQILSKRFSR